MYRRFYICIYHYHYAFITCGGFSLYIGFIVANALTVFVILRYILGCVVLYNKITMSVTPNNITINPPYKKNYLWIMTTWNNPHNIGITPYKDYMGTFQSYPIITDYQDTSTHERVTRVHHEMNE